MPYEKAPKGHTEFGGGDGLIDPVARADRQLTAEEELWEIYHSNPADGTKDLADVDLTYRPVPEPTAPTDPATARGTN